MKILILHPGKMPASPSQIECFSDVWVYYLANELQRHLTVDSRAIPSRSSSDGFLKWFEDLNVSGYDAVIALGLRYFSTVPREVGETLLKKLDHRGFLCQIHDGSRLNNDPVDITFTLKDDSARYPFGTDANRYVRHRSYNEYIGWAADPSINVPAQDPDNLHILVDHTNYGPNLVDHTEKILKDIKSFIDGGAWRSRWKSVAVRRFDSGGAVDVDFNDIHNIKKYDRRAIPFTEICQEHGQAHIFCVTHPESVGLVVLETAMAGALSVVPAGFVPGDRLDTVRAIEYQDLIPWAEVLKKINPAESRRVAMENSWANVCKRIRDVIRIRQNIRGLGQ